MLKRRRALTLSFLLVGWRLPLLSQTASVDLGATDVESGMTNSRKGEGTDGENSSCQRGAGASQREGRQPKGIDDDLPDQFLYFTVSSAAVNTQSALTITAAVFDDQAFSGHRVYLEYVNSQARDASDLRDVFSLHPYAHILAGSGAWADLAWVLRDASFANHLQHSAADFRLSSRRPDGSFTQLCFDKVQVAAGAPAPLACPSAITAAVDPDDHSVALSWDSPVAYDRVQVFRNGLRVAELSGAAELFQDSPPPGRYRYQVLPLKGGDACLSPSLQAETRLFPAVSRCGCPNPDVNGDGLVDVQDLAMVTSNLNFSPGSPRFNIEADASRDGAIDMSDVQLVLDFIRFPGPFPTLQLAMDPLGSVGSVSDPGPMLRIESPFALGSGRLEEIPDSLLHHGRLLVVSGSGSGEKLLEVDPATGAQAVFSDRSRTDGRGDPGIAGVTALSFEGPAVAVANREAPDTSPADLAGSAARLDPRSGKPLEGPPLQGAPTGVFTADQEAIDALIGPTTDQRPAGGFLNETGGIAEGAAGPDGPELSPQNRILFQSGWESDSLRRRAFITATDLDTGLYEVAAIAEPAEGLPGPLAFVKESSPAPSSFAGVATFLAQEAQVQNQGEGFQFAGGELDAARARAEDAASFNVDLAKFPAAGDYAVRLTARLLPGFHFTRLRLELARGGSVLERRLYPGLLPGKLRSTPVIVPVGRIAVRKDVLGERLVLRALEPGISIQSLELEGPVGDRLLVATRDPGSIRDYGLALAEGPNGETLFRGILERIFGVCEVEAARDAEVIIDPAAMALLEIQGEKKLLLLDSLRKQASFFSLEGELERCVHVPLADAYLTGGARAPGGAAGSGGEFPALFLGTRSLAGGGGDPGGNGEAGGPSPPGEGRGGIASGLYSLLDIDAIFFDRSASHIIDPLVIGDRRALVLKALFSDGSVREVTDRADYVNLHPEVVELLPFATVRARRSAGFADIRAELQGLTAETRVHVSARVMPFRLHRPVPFNAAPLVLPDETLKIYPNPEAMEAAFGTSFDLLRFPVGYRQGFTAVKFDSQGRASGVPSVIWTLESAAGNEIDPAGVFSANQSENPAAVGIGAPAGGLSLKAKLEGSGGSFQPAELESEALPMAVYDPVEIAGAPARAIRIFPRDVDVLPGSAIRFVAVLLDENGLVKNIEPPPGDLDPNLPGARWSSDGLPIDERTGLFLALYSGETADETSTVTTMDPMTGLADSVRVKVLYSQTNGLESLADAHVLRLTGAMLLSELKELFLAADRSLVDVIEFTKAEAPGLAEQVLEGDLEKFLGKLDFILFQIRSAFEVEFLSEMVLEIEPNPTFSLVDAGPAPGSDALEIRLHLRVNQLLNAAIKNFDLKLSLDLFSFLSGICNLISQVICDEDICDLAQNLSKKPEQKPAEKADLIDEIVGSRFEYVSRLSLASGQFGPTFESAVWKAKNKQKMEEFLAEQFVKVSGLNKQLDILKSAVLLILFGKDKSACQLNLTEIVIRPVAKGVCTVLAAILGVVGIHLNVDNCTNTLAEWIESELRGLIDKLFDGLNAKIVEFLADTFKERVIVPVEKFLYEKEVEKALHEVELGFSALTSADDLGRAGSLRFGGSGLSDPTVALESPPIGRFQGSSLFSGHELPGYAQGMMFGYELFPSHVSLAAFPREGFPSANPLDPENGPPSGNLGVASRADDVFSNLLRYGGSTAYKTAAGALRGAISLNGTAVSTPDGQVALAASSAGSPRLVFEESVPGGLKGRVEQLVLVRGTGALDYTVSAVASAPLALTRSGQEIRADMAAGPPAAILAPAAGEVPLAQEIRALVASAFPDLRGFLTATLGAKLPVSIEFPQRLGERDGIGRFEVALEGADTDSALEDDLLTADFVPAGLGGGGLQAPAPRLLRGDCNDDGQADLTDAVFLLRALHGEGRSIPCLESCDFDGNGPVNPADPIYLLQWLVMGGPAPPAPFPQCGPGNFAALCPGGSHGCP
ncbi:MAG: hypothetical protein HY717_09950 [Planctomycetes bacterium]|nr:hypothetical protein [Planctomycetota bacterium]